MLLLDTTSLQLLGEPDTPYVGGSAYLHLDRCGNLWTSASTSGVIRFDGTYAVADNGTSNSLLLCDSRGDLWWEHGSKATRYDGATSQVFYMQSDVVQFLEDALGAVWIASESGHLVRVADGDTVQEFDIGGDVWHAVAGPSGAVWFRYRTDPGPVHPLQLV